MFNQKISPNKVTDPGIVLIENINIAEFIIILRLE